ncbi:EpsG family protein [Alcaligenes faecalis]|uniref:EpsG family protein n=1 Tax=Alcaligenes faecalis TaxID=511 RepID=UPI001EEFDBF7|nr:EpsG family protein [Alcaligenes faecalis]ULH06406.1 EpsG family protein [Alcaligenes faecalis]
MFYIILWIFNFLCFLTLKKSRYTGKFFFILLFIVLAAASTLRGLVGTDTHSYEHIIEEYINQVGKLNWEPVFGFLFYGFADLTQSPTLTVRLVTLSISVVFFAYFIYASKDEAFVFVIYFLPVFYFSYSMNALRLGMGSVFILHAAHQLARYKYVNFTGLGALAVLSHYSHALSVFYLYLLSRKIAIKWYFLSVILVPLFFLLLFYFKHQYFSEKLNLYLTFSAPSIFSGAPKVLSCILLILAGLTSSISRELKIRFALLSLAMLFLAYSLVFISYAGLRFLDLISFLIPLAFLNLHTSEKETLTKSSKWLIATASVISLLFLYRSFVNEEHSSISPFLPYKLLF